MTTTITVLLVLGLAAWAAWFWYYRHWLAAHKWEQEQTKARVRLRTGENLIYDSMRDRL
jgi:hypothetical protein